MSKILICAKEENLRESLMSMLSDHYDLILTGSGEQCLECFVNCKSIQLILAELTVLRSKSFHVLKEIKKHSSGVKVVGIAAHGSIELVNEAIRLGVSGCVVRPFKEEEILTVVRNSLKR